MTGPAPEALVAAAGAALPPGAGGRIAVAVSGGSDSTAALHLLARVAPPAGWSVAAVTVDHRLRAESAAEAAAVGRAAAALGLPHAVLVWDHGPVAGNLAAAARAARYGLLANWARAEGIGRVVLGHTADDQAETLLMALARRSGLDGLSGMRPAWDEGGVRFVRPFLGITRAALRAWLAAEGIGWIEDPGNADPRRTRTRARRALARLAPLGITAEGLAVVARHLAEARRALNRAAADAAARVAAEVAGEVRLDRAGLAALDPELRRRLLAAALAAVGGGAHPPRAPSLARLEAAALAGRGATLAGCRLLPDGAHLALVREPRAVAGLVAPSTALWDGRWRLEGPHAPGLELRALGAAGLALCPDWRGTGASRAALLVSPAVWAGPRLVAAPLAGRPAGWRAELLRTLSQTLLRD